MPNPRESALVLMSRNAKRSRQTAAGIIRQALLEIEASEPLSKYGKELVGADRQALEAAFAALTAPSSPTKLETRRREELRPLEEELGLYD